MLPMSMWYKDVNLNWQHTFYNGLLVNSFILKDLVLTTRRSNMQCSCRVKLSNRFWEIQLGDAFKKEKKSVWRHIVATRGGGGKKRCQMSQLKTPFYYGAFLGGEGVKLLLPFPFLHKEVKRKFLTWKVKF